MVETRTINAFAAMAADPATSSDELRSMGSTLVHSVGGTAVLLVVVVLNVYKPRGLTPYGWRKLREQRRSLPGSSQHGQPTSIEMQVDP